MKNILLLTLLALSLTAFGQPPLIPYSKNGMWGYCNSTKEVIVPCIYKQVLPFSQGMARVQKGEKFGFIDSSGHEVVPCSYISAGDYFSEGIVPVENTSGLYGYIDKTGETVIPFTYSIAYSFSEGLATAMPAGKDYYVFINRAGVITKTPCNSLSLLREGKASGQIDGVACLIDKAGKLLLPANPDIVSYGDFHQELCVVDAGNNKYGFVNASGLTVIPFHYQQARHFEEGLAPVKQNGKWGFINRKNEVVLPFEYSQAFSFHEGFALVEKDGKTGFINAKGEVKIPLKFSGGESFQNGIALVRLLPYGQEVYIDKEGREYF